MLIPPGWSTYCTPGPEQDAASGRKWRNPNTSISSCCELVGSQ